MKALLKNVDIIIPYKTTFYFSDYMKITHIHTHTEEEDSGLCPLVYKVRAHRYYIL